MRLLSVEIKKKEGGKMDIKRYDLVKTGRFILMIFIVVVVMSIYTSFTAIAGEPKVIIKETFDGEKIDTTKWKVKKEGIVEIVEGKLHLKAAGGRVNANLSTKKRFSPLQNYILEFDIYPINNEIKEGPYGVGASGPMWRLQFIRGSTVSFVTQVEGKNKLAGAPVGNLPKDTWYHVVVKNRPENMSVKVMYKESGKEVFKAYGPRDPGLADSLRFWATTGTGGTLMGAYFDNVVIKVKKSIELLSWPENPDGLTESLERWKVSEDDFGNEISLADMSKAGSHSVKAHFKRGAERKILIYRFANPLDLSRYQSLSFWFKVDTQDGNYIIQYMLGDPEEGRYFYISRQAHGSIPWSKVVLYLEDFKRYRITTRDYSSIPCFAIAFSYLEGDAEVWVDELHFRYEKSE